MDEDLDHDKAVDTPSDSSRRVFIKGVIGCGAAWGEDVSDQRIRRRGRVKRNPPRQKGQGPVMRAGGVPGVLRLGANCLPPPKRGVNLLASR